MNKKDNKKTYNKYKLIQLYVILGVLLFSYGIFITYRYLKISGNSNTVLNNVYLSQFDLSNATYDQVKEQLSLYNDNILDQVVILKYNDKDTTFAFVDKVTFGRSTSLFLCIILLILTFLTFNLTLFGYKYFLLKEKSST